MRALTDPHSPGKYRVNGLVVNMPEFARAFSCKAEQPMVVRSAAVSGSYPFSTTAALALPLSA